MQEIAKINLNTPNPNPGNINKPAAPAIKTDTNKIRNINKAIAIASLAAVATGIAGIAIKGKLNLSEA